MAEEQTDNQWMQMSEDDHSNNVQWNFVATAWVFLCTWRMRKPVSQPLNWSANPSHTEKLILQSHQLHIKPEADNDKAQFLSGQKY